MRITPEEILHVANLARLEISGAEVDAMAGQLDKILGYVEKMNELDTTEVIPITHALQLTNAFREDMVHPSLAQEEALQNGPHHNNEAFVVPKVI